MLGLIFEEVLLLVEKVEVNKFWLLDKFEFLCFVVFCFILGVLKLLLFFVLLIRVIVFFLFLFLLLDIVFCFLMVLYLEIWDLRYGIELELVVLDLEKDLCCFSFEELEIIDFDLFFWVFLIVLMFVIFFK